MGCGVHRRPKMVGELDAGKPYVRFDEGTQGTYSDVARLRPTLRREAPDKNTRYQPPSGGRGIADCSFPDARRSGENLAQPRFAAGHDCC